MLVSRVIVEDGVDGLARGDLALNCVEQANELLMSMGLHVAADHGSIEDVHGRKQGGRAAPLVVMGHRSGAAANHIPQLADEFGVLGKLGECDGVAAHGRARCAGPN